jgi:ribosomal protein S8
MNINKDTYKDLQKFEMYFRQAHYGSYLMNCSSKTTLEVVDIAKKCGYVGSVNVTCNSCKIKFFKEVAKEYFTYQKSIENKKKKKIEEIEKGDN